jgi:phosphate:Na+ symporter
LYLYFILKKVYLSDKRNGFSSEGYTQFPDALWANLKSSSFKNLVFAANKKCSIYLIFKIIFNEEDLKSQVRGGISMIMIVVGKFVLALLMLLGGIRFVSRSLQEIAGGFLHDLLKRYTSTTSKGFLLGAISTVFLQSSSLVTVMVVGFINGRFLTLKQGLSIVIGANLGTTITSQLFSFEARQLIIPLIISGSAVYIIEILSKKRLGGKILLGVALLLSGIEFLSISLEPLSSTTFYNNLFIFSKGAPSKALLMGALAAAVLQSSSVTIGMVILMARENMLKLPEALAMILGADLGTCITSMIASLGTILPARQVAWGHLLFNFASILIIIPFWKHFLNLISITSADFSRQVANSHAFYNLVGVIVFLPLIDKYTNILEYIIKDRHKPPKLRQEDYK